MKISWRRIPKSGGKTGNPVHQLTIDGFITQGVPRYICAYVNRKRKRGGGKGVLVVWILIL